MTIFSGSRLIDGTITDAKLVAISAAGKVLNSATTATNANTASAIVARDASGNFTAGTITATSFSGSGASLTALSATNLSTGTVADARLSTNVVLLSGTQTLTGAKTFSGGITLSAGSLTLFADPTAAMHAATKQYVDNSIMGLDTKASVKVATTANITLSATQTIDGVAVVAGDRVLVKNQTTGSQNGVYVVAAGAWTRATDFDGSPATETSGAAYFFVERGDTQADSGWVLTNDGSVVVGTDVLNFTQFSGAGQITAGAALSKSGNQLNVQVDNATIEIASNAIKLKALGITDAFIAASAAIADTKLATISTAGKVANSATTATSAATANTIVARDANGRAQVADPAAATDIATKQYVDNATGGGSVAENITPSGTINGTNTAFTLPNTPIDSSVKLYLSGLRLAQTTHYSVSGSTITFVSGFQPVSGEYLIADYRY
jgi:autotransporter-associated beta strand protein